MLYLLTVCIFLISSVFISCRYYKADVGYSSFEEMPIKKSNPKRGKRSIESVEPQSSEKSVDSLVQKVTEVAPVIPSNDSRKFPEAIMTPDDIITRLKSLKSNLLSPKAFQAISQIMEVNGKDTSKRGEEYTLEDRFVLDFYNPKILEINEPLVTGNANSKSGSFFSEKQHTEEVKVYGLLFTKNIFSPSKDIDPKEFKKDNPTKIAYLYTYNDYKFNPKLTNIPTIDLELNSVKDTQLKQVSVGGFGSVIIQDKSEESIQLQFGTKRSYGTFNEYYEDRIVMDENGRPISGKLTVFYCETQGCVGSKSHVFDFSKLSQAEKEALKKLRIFNIQ